MLKLIHFNNMQKRYLVSLKLLFAAIIAFAALYAFSAVRAEPNIQFPVKELGGCGSQSECHAYCEIPANGEACINFAEKNGLMSQEEILTARKFFAAGGVGPGGCTTKNSCESYCDNIANIKECVAFAESSGMMSGKDLEEAKMVIRALDAGAKMPSGCTSKEECDSYCGPGASATAMKECIAFAKAAGFMSTKELAEVDKIMGALEQGIRPPACRGDEECSVYCSQPQNIEECVAFATAAGMMSEKDAEMMRKTGGKGPGGCVGKQCETFCKDPANRGECSKWAKENGIMSPDEKAGRQERMGNFKAEFEKMPSVIQQCLRETLGSDLDNMLNGLPTSVDDLSPKMDSCWQLMGPPPQGSEMVGPPPSGNEPREQMMPPEGMMPPQEMPRADAILPPPPQGEILPPPPESLAPEQETEQPTSLLHLLFANVSSALR